MTRVVALVRLATAASILAAVAGLAWEQVEAGTFIAWDFFGFFTIQANLIAAVSLLIATRLAGREPAWLELVRLTVTVMLGIVTVVYWAMLAPIDTDVLRWTNLVVHAVAGPVLLADWLLVGRRAPLPWRQVPWVLLYPMTWVAATLVRGAVSGWFPYPFLDPALGYAAIGTVVTGIAAVALLAGAALSRLTRWRIAAAP